MAMPLLVSVVDDDESVREALAGLLRELGYAVAAFASAHHFLDKGDADATRCLILDVSMPGMSGPELQRELKAQGRAIPIVFISAQADPALRPALLAEGAVAYLQKPFGEPDLLQALAAAMPLR